MGLTVKQAVELASEIAAECPGAEVIVETGRTGLDGNNSIDFTLRAGVKATNGVEVRIHYYVHIRTREHWDALAQQIKRIGE